MNLIPAEEADRLQSAHKIARTAMDGSDNKAPDLSPDVPFVVIELWFHELLYFLAWRDTKGRYKQTLLGVL